MQTRLLLPEQLNINTYDQISLTWSIKLHEDIFVSVHNILVKIGGVQFNHMTGVLLHMTMTISLAVDKVNDVISLTTSIVAGINKCVVTQVISVTTKLCTRFIMKH